MPQRNGTGTGSQSNSPNNLPNNSHQKLGNSSLECLPVDSLDNSHHHSKHNSQHYTWEHVVNNLLDVTLRDSQELKAREYGDNSDLNQSIHENHMAMEKGTEYEESYCQANWEFPLSSENEMLD
jgi:hypothetical protein